jgi:uncharacterized protein with PQ loop repeat
MSFTFVLGIAATINGTLLTLPQIINMIRTKLVRDVLWGFLWMYFGNCVLWFLYGYFRDDTMLQIANGIALCLATIQLFLKHRYRT